MWLDDKFTDADVSTILGWLLLPPEPIRSPDESDEEFEGRLTAHSVSITKIEQVRDRLSDLFDNVEWTKVGGETTLKSGLGEWMLTEARCTELQRQVAASDDAGEGFREWLADEIAKWEAGEGGAQDNPEFDETRPWTRYYKYDAVADTYFYADAEHADEWLTWDEWEPEQQSQPTLESDQDLHDLPAEQDAEPGDAVLESVGQDFGYPVYTHVATGLALPYDEESQTWLYGNEWLTDDQVTSAVNPVQEIAEPVMVDDSDEAAAELIWGGWSIGSGDEVRYGLTEDGPWPYASEESAQADMRIADSTVERILEEYDVDPQAIYARVLKQVAATASAEG